MEELFVEIDGVSCLVEQRDCLFGHFGEFRRGQRAVVMVEHSGHPLQDGGKVFEREDCVVEVRGCAVGRDCEEVLLLLFYSGFDGRDEVSGL